MVSQEDRSAIVAHNKREMPILEIAKSLKFRYVQVQRIVERLQETGGIKHRQRSGRPRTARTPALKKKGTQSRLCDDVQAYQKGSGSQIVQGPTLMEEHKASRVEKCLRMRTLARGHFCHSEAVSTVAA
ncbi:hypothetical protein L596_008550 [Steinernema carpocapsae]|uniref:Paired domain-containing protein n=1 Tax=Steinernema carpocapsae TaxID=34508 RepID=A0A4U5PCZ4_STECR|nr:hypothetical protein L596_008550 [Steinernema carpocapsae]